MSSASGVRAATTPAATATLVRPMTLDDCAAVAAVRVLGWKSAYAGLLPQSYLDALSVEQDTELRREHFTGAGPEVVNLVAERAGEVIGWACWGPDRGTAGTVAEPALAELYTLYLDPGRISTGAGRALLTACLGQARGAGFGAMAAWVLKSNVRALRFYGKAGFRAEDVEEPFEMAGVTLYDVRCTTRLSEAAAAAPNFG
ncbi:GNAT family N-acetyltransferase [Streptomyces sp. NPDC051561]|uniref:GNAT family N-acetyltransferase n=1 Tax=Streptomyces sp. NPDC051561 TaxID=3365658 RepID=UPI00379097D9